MREAGLKYSLLFPAKLKIIQDNNSYFFTSAEAAWEWMENRFPDKAKKWNRQHPHQMKQRNRKTTIKETSKPPHKQVREEQRLAIVQTTTMLRQPTTTKDYASATGSEASEDPKLDTICMNQDKTRRAVHTSLTAEETADTDTTE